MDRSASKRLLVGFDIGIRKNSCLWLGLLTALSCLTLSCAHGGGNALGTWEAESADRVRIALRGNSLVVGDTILSVSRDLSAFYLERGDRLIWCGPRGPGRQADALYGVLRAAEGDGLDPQRYHVETIGALLALWRMPGGEVPSVRTSVELDLLLTNAFIRYGNHMLRGRIDPRTVHDFWDAPYVQGGLADLLETALDLQQVRETLDNLRPPQGGYARLKNALARYRAVKQRGGWVQVSAQGDGLRERLEMSGDLSGVKGEALSAALRRFQRRRHINPSGRLDGVTLAVINQPVEDQIAQIELNMERWRWLPHDPEARYILVRLDDYELDFISRGRREFTVRTIVGKEYWRTPIFSAVMTHLVLNPYWYVPRSIAVGEMLPILQRDPSYALRNGLRISRGRGVAVQRLEPETVDWDRMTASNFDVQIAQVPGRTNPLGVVKFYFQNPYNVYLHDTPNKALFERDKREFSHGCIRVEDSEFLAQHLLDGWEGEELENLIASGRNRQIVLDDPLPVFLLYWTAWVGDDGLLYLREDAYQSDNKMRKALGKTPL